MKNGVVDKLIYHVMKMIITMELPRVLRDKLRSFQGVYLNMIQGYVRILQGGHIILQGAYEPCTVGRTIRSDSPDRSASRRKQMKLPAIVVAG